MPSSFGIIGHVKVSSGCGSWAALWNEEDGRKGSCPTAGPTARRRALPRPTAGMRSAVSCATGSTHALPEGPESNPDYAEAHYNLGIALTNRGRLDEVIEHYQKALGLASARNDKALADVIRARIKLHQPAAPAGNVP